MSLFLNNVNLEQPPYWWGFDYGPGFFIGGWCASAYRAELLASTVGVANISPIQGNYLTGGDVANPAGAYYGNSVTIHWGMWADGVDRFMFAFFAEPDIREATTAYLVTATNDHLVTPEGDRLYVET